MRNNSSDWTARPCSTTCASRFHGMQADAILKWQTSHNDYTIKKFKFSLHWIMFFSLTSSFSFIYRRRLYLQSYLNPQICQQFLLQGWHGKKDCIMRDKGYVTRWPWTAGSPLHMPCCSDAPRLPQLMRTRGENVSYSFQTWKCQECKKWKLQLLCETKA